MKASATVRPCQAYPPRRILPAMRPAILDPLFASISSLSGVGPKAAELLVKLLDRETIDDCRVIDLLFHAPHSIIDRREQPGIARAPQGQSSPSPAASTATSRRRTHAATCPTASSCMTRPVSLGLVFFRGKAQWLEKQLPIDEMVTVSGKVDWFNGRPSMVHPDYIMRESEAENLPLVEPVYPLTAGLSSKFLRKTIEAAMTRMPELPEWDDVALTQKQGFPSISDSFHMLHAPRDAADIDSQAPARRRLAYDEFLAGQLSLSLVRQRLRKVAGQPVNPTGSISRKILGSLPFSMTNSQSEAIADILKDMAGTERMLRLLQGDVGAGKTLVALMAIAAVIESGGQAVLMAPTEILARQHHATISKFAASADLSVEVLTGRTKGRERDAILERIASGEAQIVIGTHALFQDSVTYANLMLAVVDEQHRFGVHQRLRLTAKGISPHMLVMTATPIPRTLVLAAFGDMDVSKLTEKPAGRKPIQTITIPSERTGDIVSRLGSALSEGKKAYWICPLVEESEESGFNVGRGARMRP